MTEVKTDMRSRIMVLLLVFGYLSSDHPVCALPALKILGKVTQARPHGISEVRYTIGIVSSRPSGTLISTAQQVEVTAWGPTHPGRFAPVPAVCTNRDASLMAIESMPYWNKRGRRRFGRRISLVVATANDRIKVIKDFSVRLNRLALANVSQWQDVSGYFHRPASDIFMGAIEGRKIYANQYMPDPKVGLPEYITIGVEVSPAGTLKFLSYTSQGF